MCLPLLFCLFLNYINFKDLKLDNEKIDNIESNLDTSHEDYENELNSDYLNSAYSKSLNNSIWGSSLQSQDFDKFNNIMNSKDWELELLETIEEEKLEELENLSIIPLIDDELGNFKVFNLPELPDFNWDENKKRLSQEILINANFIG